MLCQKTMEQSYTNISFSSERRGAQDYEYYLNLLKSDLEALGDNQGNYEQKFIDKVMTIYHRQARCASAFIVGPAKYNLGRHNKSWNSRDKALDDFNHWRTKYFKAVNRVRTLSPEAEIDKTLEQLERLEARRDIYKASRKLKTSEEVRTFLEENELLDSRTISYLEYGKGHIPSFVVTSLTTKIRERKKKLEVMKNRIDNKSCFEKIYFNGGFIDIENDRVVVCHDEKPSREVIQGIKSHGFRYSPKCKNWCRKHTENAIYSTMNLLNNVLGGKIDQAN